MAASPGTRSDSRNSESSQDKTDPYGQLLDERDFNAMLLVPEPVSQEAIEPQSSARQPKKFFASTDEISETALSQGFAFPRREPPRPGQFSKRPLHSPPRIPRPVKPTHFTTGDPLDLPELCLEGPLSLHRPPDGQPSSHQRLPPSNIFQKSGPAETSHKTSSPDKPLSSSPKKLQSRTVENAKVIVETSSSAKPTSSPVRSACEDVPQMVHVHHDVLHSKNHLNSPKLPPCHVQRLSRNERQQSPASTCGDLEGPTHRSPVKSRRYPREDLVNRPVSCRTPQDREKFSRHRSQSRASNISKKRASVHKHRSRSDPERKKVAMHQVAQYWNECIQIAEEENMQANLEIERLQEDICRREQELQDSRAMMDKKDDKIRDVENHCKKLQEEDSRVAEENKVLSDEVQSLRDQLSESQTRRETLTDRYDDHQSKLNDVIIEHEKLFRSCRSYYQETMDELRKENARKTVDSETIDKALENSRKKREEMRKCLDEFRTETEREIRHKDQAISELQENIKDHEVNLMKERHLTDKLHTQIEAQQNTHKSVEGLENKLDSLFALYSKKDDERQKEHQTNAEIMSQIHAKLDSMIADNQQSASKTLSLDDIEARLADIQDKIVTRILSEVLSVSNGQNGLGDAISQIQITVKKELDDIRGEINQQNEGFGKIHEKAENQTRGMFSLLGKFGEDLQKTQGACEEMGQRLETWMEGEKTHKEATKSSLNNLTQQLMDRVARIEDLEHRLQVVCEHYATKVEAMQADASTDGETTRKMVQNTIAELQSVLEEGFQQEREWTTQNLHQSEAGMAALAAQLNDAKEQLGQLAKASTHISPDFQLLQKSLHSEKDTVAQLKQKVVELEQEAKASELLSQRWRQDIQAIDMVRSQLQVIQEQIPLVESFGAKLDNISKTNGILQSTACYLAGEREWVHQQLEGEAESHTTTMASLASDINEPLAVSGVISSHEFNQYHSIQEEFKAIVSQPLSKADITCRKVTVHSPAGHAYSPSPPPSIRQEQRRRREGTQLRSILKNHGPPEPELNNVEAGSLQPQANYSKYNRPVVGVFNGTGAGVANEVVAEIRSGLIRPCDWRLPTVADFEKNNHLASSKGQAMHDKRALSRGNDTNDRDAKKVRTEQHATQN